MATTAKSEIAVSERCESRYSPEFELLLACCAHRRDSDRLAQALGSRIDCEIALRLAEHHRVLPALHAAMSGRDDLPASIASDIRSRAEKNALKALRFSAELARIARAFAERGVEALAHKGPLLAQLLYGDPAMRQFGDLDFLVRPVDVARAKETLRDLGYELQLHLSPRQERAYLRSGYEYVFALGGQRNLLELQWRLLPGFYAVEFDIDAIFERSVEVTIEGFRVRTLGCEDLMLALCAHAAKHGWAQLGMLRDIATLSDFQLNWGWILKEARRLGIVRILTISISLAAGLLGCGIPDAIASTGEIPSSEKLTHDLELRISDGQDPDTNSLQYFRDFARTREGWQDRARLATRLALTPSVGEWESVRIPGPLFPLYRLVRIGRLLKRACSL
jgi:hypothetical protein